LISSENDLEVGNVKIRDLDLGEFPLLLAPMEDVSDPPFRFLCKEQGCDMLYTEFISVEGLIRDAEKSIKKLDIYDSERPIGIQIFGAELDSMLQATDIVLEAKPELLDINYGCPVKKVVCKDAGAGILKDVPKMIRLTEAIVMRTPLPATVKTRLGLDDNSNHILEVVACLVYIGISIVTIHVRYRSIVDKR
jgi:tRNA-dihydrouridine synthase